MAARLAEIECAVPEAVNFSDPPIGDELLNALQCSNDYLKEVVEVVGKARQ